MYIGSVKFFKHIIVVFLTILVLTPTVLCVMLFARLDTLNQRVLSLEASLNELTVTLDNAAIEGAVSSSKTHGDDDVSVAGDAVSLSSQDSTELSYRSLYPDLRTEIPAQLIKKEKAIYLTFDDGPSENTIAVLDTLDKYNAKACFFVTGNGNKNPRYSEIMKEITKRGHTIAIHTYSHEYKKIYSSVDAYLEDFNEIYNLIYEITGVKPTIFRFPGGSINGYNSHIYQEIIAEMTRRGFLYYDWNISAQDASKAATVQSITTSVLTGVDKVSRGIVLMHDSTYTASTLASLPTIIEGVIARGYTIEPLTNDVAPIIFSYEN